ncbi:MAG TPA: hypothetical protein VJ771_07265 [Candidatus Nitrosotalea sp.]|nr:hypothetical protein [Candidatus Nitrosotalea sp.]
MPRMVSYMSGNSPDLRDKVADSRGFFKKLQLAIPGLKEYRKLEDIRAADELLRKQVFDKLDGAKGKLEALRKAMADKGEFTTLTPIGSAISRIQQISGEVFHSQQGSAGISPNIRIDENTLNKLYEYDFNFVNSAEQIFSTVDSSLNDYMSGTTTSQAIASKIGPLIDDFNHSWKQRLESVENILVTK